MKLLFGLTKYGSILYHSGYISQFPTYENSPLGENDIDFVINPIMQL